MKIRELYTFVAESDVTVDKDHEQRERIATLGLVSEIGSIFSALKKDMLSDFKSDSVASHLFRAELKEEIGDTIWYTVMLAQLLEDPRACDVFRADIDTLRSQLSGRTRNDKRIQEELGPERRQAFLDASESYCRKHRPWIDLYQETAYHTRRTDGDQLRNVCAAVLQQLAAQLSRDFLPNMEMGLNHEVRPKDPVDALGEIVWHLAALASLYKLRLSEAIKLTQKKVKFRNPKGNLSPRHDKQDLDSERFPDRFEIHFVDNGLDRAKMYWVKEDGKILSLGDPLTDNSHSDDGYRFHDVMHIAFAVYLGWSPNLRSFMNLKRKNRPKRFEEVEDGGRAKILEEAVILQIHLQAQRHDENLSQVVRIETGSPYGYPNTMSFEFLRHLHDLTYGYEVYANPMQDWERAIREGYDCYHKLRKGKGGVVSANMVERAICFRVFSKKERLIDYGSTE